MRSALALIVVALGSAIAADPVKRTAIIDVDGVELRAGHALGFPAVGKLRKGETVIVVREEETGFYAILPPAGSVSWIKQIHLGKLEHGDGGKANVPVAVEGAEVMAGSTKEAGPTNRITARLPKGTIVEVVGPAMRVDKTSSWYPITPPEGDLRWIPKSALRAASLTALAPPAPYVKPDTPPFTVIGSGGKPDGSARTAAAALPKVLTDHRLWAQASQAEKNGDHATARTLYARIYQDLWDQKAERDAIVICYNRYTRCGEAVKKGGTSPRPGDRSDSRKPPGDSTSISATTGGKWSSRGKLQELKNVYVDGQQVFSFDDDRGAVMYYVTGVSGINLRNYNSKIVQLYGIVTERPELYRPHMAVERVEVAK
jgi:hypothetical protein